jgi:hypothetical protein
MIPRGVRADRPFFKDLVVDAVGVNIRMVFGLVMQYGITQSPEGECKIPEKVNG